MAMQRICIWAVTRREGVQHADSDPGWRLDVATWVYTWILRPRLTVCAAVRP